MVGVSLAITSVAVDIVQAEDTPARLPGLTLRVYEVGQDMHQVPRLVEGQSPNVNQPLHVIDLKDKDFGFDDFFYVEIDGYLRVDRPGRYGFHLSSDDGSLLMIDGKTVIDNNGLHPFEAVSANIELDAGQHEIEIRYFDNTGDAALRLEWTPPGVRNPGPIPADRFSSDDQVRVTSPGKKEIDEPGDAGRSPGDGMPVEGAHPGYDLVTLHPEDFNPQVGGLDFLSDGRLVLCTWDKVGGVYVLDGVLGPNVEPEQVSVKRIAAGLAEPLGLSVIQDPQTGKDRIFVLQKQELTELIDHNGDELIDEYLCVSDQWAVSPNFHEFAFGLIERGGKFYGTLAVAIDPGGATTRDQSPGRGTVLEIDRESGEVRIIASGLRTPNGIGFGPDDTIVVMDNQGAWRPASTLHVVREGDFLGHYMPNPTQDQPNAVNPVAPPAVWLPHGEIGKSPAEPVLITEGPYKGQMLHAEVTHGGIKRDFLEQIDGTWQGCVFRFSQGFEAGVNRIVFGPEGALYAGCIGTQGDWSHEGRRRGLQKLVPNGEAAFEMLAVRAMSNGYEIEFTQPLAEGVGWNPADYGVRQWWYEPTPTYGGSKRDQAVLSVRSASVSPDRRRVFLEVLGLKPGHVTHLRLNKSSIASEAGQPLWSTEAWYTLNVIPTGRTGVVIEPPAHALLPTGGGPHNVLTDDEKAKGWQLLFDGQTIDQWRGFRKDRTPAGWQVQDGAIARVGGGGDIITKDQFDDFELKLQWKIGEGGNSGIFTRVAEEVDGNPLGAVWETGPEMQVLDNDRHHDGRNPKTSAGAAYALYAAPRGITKPVGEWNDVHIIAGGSKITYKLNGVVTAEYDTASPEWAGLVAGSKFNGMPHFAKMSRGHIALQDHGDPVWYRNIMIKPAKE